MALEAVTNADGSLRDRSEFLGCAHLRVARSTGAVVGVYQAGPTGMDVDAGAWALVCETHDACVNVESWREAKKFAPWPANWCEECEAIMAAKR